MAVLLLCAERFQWFLNYPTLVLLRRLGYIEPFMNEMSFQLGPIADVVDAALRDAQQQQVVKRIWRKDASLWKTDPKAHDNIRSSLGWLTVTDEMIGVADELMEYAEFIRQRGFQYVMVCGMGGSSLCPEVLRRSFGQQPHLRPKESITGRAILSTPGGLWSCSVSP